MNALNDADNDGPGASEGNHGRRMPASASGQRQHVREDGTETPSPTSYGMPPRIEEIKREAGWSEKYTRLTAIVTIALLAITVAIYALMMLGIIPGR